MKENFYNYIILFINKYLMHSPYKILLKNFFIKLIPMITSLIIIGIALMGFVNYIKQHGKSSLDFVQNPAKIFKTNKDFPTLNSLAGCLEAKEEVMDIINFLKNTEKYKQIGAKIPRGLLFIGPPGTGKTLLAKAIATETKVPFFSISGSDFIEMFVGVGASRVRHMFEQAKKHTPCILFIDEIDAIGKKRGWGIGGNDEREQTLNSLLVEMDGFDTINGLIIIAATNRPDVLDSALLRPGRFDRKIILGLPDIKGRKAILQMHLKKINIRNNIDFFIHILAQNTSGFSGADLANLVNESALIAVKHNRNYVKIKDIEEARDKIAFGKERHMIMDIKDKTIIAYHEAGHAIIQAFIDKNKDFRLHKVTIIPRGNSLGSTMFTLSKDIINYSKKYLLNQICCSLGGRIAEFIIFNDVTSGAESDIESATKIARNIVCKWGMSKLGPINFNLEKNIKENNSEKTSQLIDSQVQIIIKNEYIRASKIILKHKKSLNKISEALLKYETINGNLIYEIIKKSNLI